MTRLGVITIAGLGIAVVCLAGVAAIGINQSGDALALFDDADCGPITGDATATSREFPWNGGDSVSITVPATVHYTPGAGTKVIAQGDPATLARLEVHDGRIEPACHMRWRHHRLDITLPGRAFRAYHLAGMVDLNLQNLSQDSLSLSFAGKNSVTADGKVADLSLDAAGKSEAHLKNLIAQRVKLHIMGRSDIETAPQDDANIVIVGSGSVKLYSEPKHLDTNIMGSGNVEHLAKGS